MNDIHEFHHEGHDHYSQGHEDQASMPFDERHPLWASERVELRSVGIDIGTSTTHLMFSHLVLQRQGISLSSRFRLVEKQVTYESPVLLTPFIDGLTIDVNALSAFFAEAYRAAKVTPQEIDTGAVIITGEAARKDNAAAIADLFSGQAGKFVCATAGPNLEGKMAAYGSGAVEKSGDQSGGGATVMNVDVGGGTSKVVIAQNGSVIDTAALNIGGRLFVLDQAGRIIRIEESGGMVAEAIGINLKIGDSPSREEKQQVAKALAEALFEVVERKPLSPLTQRLLITPPLAFEGKIDTVLFSGGVSEYIYGYEKAGHGDLGDILAQELKGQVSSPSFGIPMEEPAQRIRATVVGASQYTIQVSGSTIFISQDGLLPLHNLPVVAPRITDLTREGVKFAIRESFRHLDMPEAEYPVALALHWSQDPSYRWL